MRYNDYAVRLALVCLFYFLRFISKIHAVTLSLVSLKLRFAPLGGFPTVRYVLII